MILLLQLVPIFHTDTEISFNLSDTESYLLRNVTLLKMKRKTMHCQITT